MLQWLKFNPRIWFLLGFGGCVLMLVVAAYLQWVEGLEPCPLCISQRIMLLATGLVLLLAAIHNPSSWGLTVYSMLATLFALLGAGVAVRHLWLQNLPADQIPECGAGLAYVFENFPLLATVKLLLNGSGDCANVAWHWLGLSIPGWTLLAFLALAILSLVQQWNVAN